MPTNTATRPGDTEYAPFYEGYVSLVPDGDIVETLARGLEETLKMLRAVPEMKAGSRYADGKWSIKEVVGHMCDTERIFAYRALAVARGDRASLPGMNQDEYMSGANFDARTLADLTDEFEHLRRATVALFRHLDEAAWSRRGTANNSEVSVRALAYILAGHEAHHAQIIRNRYL